MKATLAMVLVLGVMLFAYVADALVPVVFRVDGEEVITLDREGSFRGYIVLAGQSGPGGHDERSGLYDNVSVSFWWNAHGWVIVDAFDTLELNPFSWIAYGDAAPRLVSDFGNPSPCLMSSGDSLGMGGVYWYYFINYDVGQFYFEVDVYVGTAADFHRVEFGVFDEELGTECCGRPATGARIGASLGLNAEGQSVLHCFTDIESAELAASGLVGEWHRVTFSSNNSSPVESATWTRLKAMYR